MFGSSDRYSCSCAFEFNTLINLAKSVVHWELKENYNEQHEIDSTSARQTGLSGIREKGGTVSMDWTDTFEAPLKFAKRGAHNGGASTMRNPMSLQRLSGP